MQLFMTRLLPFITCLSLHRHEGLDYLFLVLVVPFVFNFGKMDFDRVSPWRGGTV